MNTAQIIRVFHLNVDNSDQAIIPRVRFIYTIERPLSSNVSRTVLEVAAHGATISWGCRLARGQLLQGQTVLQSLQQGSGLE